MIKRTKKSSLPVQACDACAAFIRRVLPHLTGWLILLVSLSFFTATYDSAHVKLTLLHIGAVVLLALWACLKITEHKNPFSRKTWPFLAPLFIYLAWQILSFLCFPYKLEAAEEFIRLLMYGGISTLIACEFTPQDIRTVTKFIVISAWISFVYGLVQVAAIWWPSVDFLPWHNFFAGRTFSTHANPNFFGAFIVFASAIIGGEFLRTRQKKLLTLLGIGLVDLFFTESKGAWLAYGVMSVFFAFAYTNCLTRIKKHLVKINVLAVACLLIAIVGAGIYSAKRIQSVNFRTYTWLSAFEMVKDSPILGTGPGSFKLVYPAYRRPQIFYIEDAHNNETQHAENEYLEQAATGGIIGLALFLWLFVFLFTCTFKNLRAPLPPKPSQNDLSTKYYLLGYAAALAGLLVHTGVDISIHFVSSGLLLAVFTGTILALTIKNQKAQVPPTDIPQHPRWLFVAQLITSLAVSALVIYMGVEFIKILKHLALVSLGEKLLFTAAIITFIGCVAGTGYIYLRTTWKTTRIWVCAILLTSLPICIFFFNMFTANHYYSLGVALVNLKQPYAALPAFTDAIKRNPLLAEYRQYRANIFATTLDLSKRFNPALGDEDAPRTDYERATADLYFVQKHNPNHALLNQEAGQLHYALAMRQLEQTQQTPEQALLYNQLATENFSLAKQYFLKALKLDPVNVNTYLLLINISLLRHDINEAQKWVDTYYQGPSGVTEEEFLVRHRQNPQMHAVQAHIDRLKAALNR